MILLGHQALAAKRTRGDEAGREAAKVALLELLLARKMEPDDLRHWYRYLEWLLPLEPESEARFQKRARELEEVKKVPFITYAERQGIEKGLEKGRGEGLLQGLAVALKVKFGTDGATFAAELRDAQVERLQAVLAAIETAVRLDDLRKLP